MLEVIGSGYSRTGTLSLKRALETLGIGRCYHFTELRRRRHALQWLAVANGRRPDWDALFAGYTATVDWPGVAYYRELADYYPEAKVILTIRDADDWHASVCEVLLPLRRTLPDWLPWTSTLARLTDQLIWDGTFNGRAREKDVAIAQFHRHTREVRAEIAPQRLLVYDVKQGWEPLCRFLGLPVPDLPFPHTNRRSSIRAAVWLIRTGKALLIAILVTLVTGLLAMWMPWR